MNITTMGNSIIINDGEKNLYFSKVNDGWAIETDKFEEVTTFNIPTYNQDLHYNELYRIFFNFYNKIFNCIFFFSHINSYLIKLIIS